jgi:hypothetical protein
VNKQTTVEPAFTAVLYTSYDCRTNNKQQTTNKQQLSLLLLQQCFSCCCFSLLFFPDFPLNYIICPCSTGASHESTELPMMHGLAWHGMAWHGMALPDMAWPGMALPGIERNINPVFMLCSTEIATTQCTCCLPCCVPSSFVMKHMLCSLLCSFLDKVTESECNEHQDKLPTS